MTGLFVLMIFGLFKNFRIEMLVIFNSFIFLCDDTWIKPFAVCTQGIFCANWYLFVSSIGTDSSDLLMTLIILCCQHIAVISMFYDVDGTVFG
jgi:hypothetical protein